CGAAHIYLMGDADSDSWPANCDNCPTAFNPSQSDGDGNGAGDACDCFCPCHGDPVCDGVVTVLDVVMAVNAAFRGDDPVTDPGCPRAQTDVSCDGFTNVLDVVKYVNVAFRSGDPATEFCDPCVF
ncbi:MAG TPA: hypothetical protein VLB27_06480, partial [candidate division Zixibacteria bacterium]|nr:hypothetical protein [candidate division Zixibacteria bacterium]